MKNFVKIDSLATEQMWQEVENELPAALSSVRAGALFASPQHVATIKQAIALHFARGMEVWEFN